MAEPPTSVIPAAKPDGLSPTQVEAARRLHGPNELPKELRPSLMFNVGSQLADPMVILLLAAAAISLLVLRDVVEGAVILAVVILNAALSVGQQMRSDRALEALRNLSAPTARVTRGGPVQVIPAVELVPGDVVHISAGDRVPADLHLDVARSLAVDEAMLTGESLPVEKVAAPEDATAPGRTLYAGTVVVRGRAVGRVTQTGTRTKLGLLAIAMERPTPPPLQRELSKAAARISVVAILASVALAAFAILRAHGDKTRIVEGLLAGVALAVAAVPEGLLAVVTAALAIGVQRMARRGSIVRRLAAIEGLGAVQVLCVDKTGTLTEGRLGVAASQAIPGREGDLWLAATRCNDATISSGDPIEVALLREATRKGYGNPAGARLGEEPFDAATRRMATVHSTPAGPVLSVKGAPEAILPLCGPDGAALESQAETWAREGLRVLAFADASTDKMDTPTLRPLGIVAFEDSIRPSAAAAVADCQRAGIQVVMVTGDHVATAASVGARVGLDASRTVSGRKLEGMDGAARQEELRLASIVARVQPQTKVELVKAHRDAGRVVAMMGDGVNDAPALRQADVGVAIAGEQGTDVAREAASIVLTDGDLGTLVAGVREGRRIYTNLVHAVSYLVAGNASEVIIVLAGLALFPELTIPLVAVQLLWINLVTDALPAIALGVDEPPDDPLGRPPRPATERLLGWGRLGHLLARGTLMAVLVLASGLLARRQGWSPGVIQTQLFASLVVTHLVMAFVARGGKWTFRAGWAKSRFLLWTVAGSLAAQTIIMTVPFLRAAFYLEPLPLAGWVLAFGAAASFVVITDFARWLGRGFSNGTRAPASP